MSDEAAWPRLGLEELLGTLCGAGVDFVVIGGAARTLLGSPRVTKDLDIAYARDTANLGVLGAVLTKLNARLRGVDEELPFVPDAQTLARTSLLTLTTDRGWLDLLAEPQGSGGYERLCANAERIRIGDVAVLVASVADMIEMKRATGRAQDLADVEELRAIQRLRDRGVGPG